MLKKKNVIIYIHGITPSPDPKLHKENFNSFENLLCSALEKVRHFVSSGNEASLTLEDYLEFFAQDKETKVIALFAEGLRAGTRFKEICLETTKTKQIVFLKAGITKTGARAANSHTGSIAGSLNFYKSVFLYNFNMCFMFFNIFYFE